MNNLQLSKRSYRCVTPCFWTNSHTNQRQKSVLSAPFRFPFFIYQPTDVSNWNNLGVLQLFLTGNLFESKKKMYWFVLNHFKWHLISLQGKSLSVIKVMQWAISLSNTHILFWPINAHFRVNNLSFLTFMVIYFLVQALKGS